MPSTALNVNAMKATEPSPGARASGRLVNSPIASVDTAAITMIATVTAARGTPPASKMPGTTAST